MKNINNFTQWKNGSVNVMFMRVSMHQMRHTQFDHSTQSAVDIFNTLRVFTKEPIREQEIMFECMNWTYASTKVMGHLCMTTVAWSSYYCIM